MLGFGWQEDRGEIGRKFARCLQIPTQLLFESTICLKGLHTDVFLKLGISMLFSMFAYFTPNRIQISTHGNTFANGVCVCLICKILSGSPYPILSYLVSVPFCLQKPHPCIKDFERYSALIWMAVIDRS